MTGALTAGSAKFNGAVEAGPATVHGALEGGATTVHGVLGVDSSGSIADNLKVGAAQQAGGSQGNIQTTNNIGVRGLDQGEGLPGDWAGGLHTWDVYAEATIGAGSGGSVKASMGSNGYVLSDAVIATRKPDGSVQAMMGSDGNISATGNIGSRGYSPTAGLPPGWAGGVHTWDVYAENNVAAGSGGTVMAYMANDDTLTGIKKRFEIPNPLDPEGAQLVHAVIEGPEYAVYYRGTGQLVDGEAVVELPVYFEASPGLRVAPCRSLRGSLTPVPSPCSPPQMFGMAASAYARSRLTTRSSRSSGGQGGQERRGDTRGGAAARHRLRARGQRPVTTAATSSDAPHSRGFARRSTRLYGSLA